MNRQTTENPELEEKFNNLKTEINIVCGLFADKGVDNPESHWSKFCGACAFAKFCTKLERKRSQINEAINHLENCKSEVTEYGLDSGVLDGVEKVLNEVNDAIEKAKADTRQMNRDKTEPRA